MITDAAQLATLIEQIESADRVAVDTEADSLHSYREKLCLLQISVPAVAGIIDAGFSRERPVNRWFLSANSDLQNRLYERGLANLKLA